MFNGKFIKRRVAGLVKEKLIGNNKAVPSNAPWDQDGQADCLIARYRDKYQGVGVIGQ